MPTRISRREFLRRSALVAAGLPGAGDLLVACTGSPPTRREARALLPRPDRPVTWPIHDDNPPIGSDLPIERGGTLRVYEWRRYLSKSVLDEFARLYRRYDVHVAAESFESRDAALARMAEPNADFDVFLPTVDQIGQLVNARLLRPLNHDHLPNLRSLWPQFRGPGGPFYDQDLRYTIPYTVFSSGIGWRTDLVAKSDAPPALDVPWNVMWDRTYRGKVGIYDDYREALSMALLRDGVTDVNTADPVALARAERSLAEMAAAVDVELTTEGAYEGLPTGEFALHQAWSGDMLSAIRWGHARRLGTVSALEYWWPTDGSGVVGCDLIAICSRGRNPVLAHAFLNHLLDSDVALRNFAWNGYQPPVNDATPEMLFGPRSPWRGSVPDRLRYAVMTPGEFERGEFLLGLDPATDAEWMGQWDLFRSGL